MITPPSCLDCHVTLVPRTEWLSWTKQQRLASGKRRHQGRGLCAICYDHRHEVGTLHELERVTFPHTDLLEEWHHYGYDPDRSYTANVRLFAARLGRAHAGVEKALTRAGVRARRTA